MTDNLFLNIQEYNNETVRVIFFSLVSVVFFAIICRVALRIKQEDIWLSIHKIGLFLAVILLLPVIVEGIYQRGSIQKSLHKLQFPNTKLPPLPVSSKPVTTPDLYCVVLDAYARQDILQEIYHIDNEPFLKELENIKISKFYVKVILIIYKQFFALVLY